MTEQKQEKKEMTAEGFSEQVVGLTTPIFMPLIMKKINVQAAYTGMSMKDITKEEAISLLNDWYNNNPKIIEALDGVAGTFAYLSTTDEFMGQRKLNEYPFVRHEAEFIVAVSQIQRSLAIVGSHIPYDIALAALNDFMQKAVQVQQAAAQMKAQELAEANKSSIVI